MSSVKLRLDVDLSPEQLSKLGNLSESLTRAAAAQKALTDAQNQSTKETAKNKSAVDARIATLMERDIANQSAQRKQQQSRDNAIDPQTGLRMGAPRASQSAIDDRIATLMDRERAKNSAIDPQTGLRMGAPGANQAAIDARIADLAEANAHKALAQHRANAPSAFGRFAGQAMGAARAGMGFAGSVMGGAVAASHAVDSYNSVGFARDYGANGNEQWRAGLGSNLIGRQVLGVFDSATGRERGMKTLDAEMDKARAKREGSESLRQQLGDYHLQRNEYANVNIARGRNRGDGSIGPIDRSTVGGENRYQEESSRVSGRNAVREATIAQDAGVMDLRTLESERSREVANRDKNVAKRKEAFAGYNNADNGVMRAAYLKAQSEFDDNVRQSEERLKKLDSSVQSGQMKVAQLKSETAAARVGAMQNELGILQGKRSQAADQSRSVGGMTMYDQEMGLAALQAVTRDGLENSSPELISRAEAFGPKTVAKLKEKRGNESPVMKKAREQYPDEFQGDLKDFDKKVQQKQDEIQVNLRVDKDKLARDVQDAFTNSAAGPFGDLIVSSMKNYVDMKLRELANKMRLSLT